MRRPFRNIQTKCYRDSPLLLQLPCGMAAMRPHGRHSMSDLQRLRADIPCPIMADYRKPTAQPDKKLV